MYCELHCKMYCELHCKMYCKLNVCRCTQIYIIFLTTLCAAFASVHSGHSDQEGLECFRKSPDECAPLDDPRASRCRKFGSDIYCCHIDSEQQLIQGLRSSVKPNEKITALHIRNMSLVRLEVNIPEWKSLVSLSITDGNISQIIGTLESSHISCLNLSNNYIQETDPQLISGLTNLVRLDMSHNNMSYVPILSSSLNKFEIDLSNNKYINCMNILDMMRMVPHEALHFDNRAQTSCCSSARGFNFNERCGPSLARSPFITMLNLEEIEFIYKIILQCPHGDGWKCDCDYRVLPAKLPDEKQRILVNVDCSNRNLEKLPQPLPVETTSLNVSNNNISSLDPVVQDPSYQSLIKLYADMNAIKSIDVFEGSTFINQFEELSLRKNQITVIPTYILSHVFSKSTLKMRVLLGDNKLHCDCNTAQSLRVWLTEHKHHIADVSKLLCLNYEESVINLDPKKICVTPRDWTDYIYYIITGEILLLLLLLGKVSYDYWVFRTQGYLPWPASKMPKLPCDTFFET